MRDFAFDVADHVQIRQAEPGKSTLIVSGDKSLWQKKISDLFELSNVAIDFNMEVVDHPICTATGKLKLKV